MSPTVTDEQIRELAATTQPYSLALLTWGPDRHQEGSDAIELEHQRRMVQLRQDGVILVLFPVLSDTAAGVALIDRPADEAEGIMADDPCVQAGMLVCEVHPCRAFPGDAVPG